MLLQILQFMQELLSAGLQRGVPEDIQTLQILRIKDKKTDVTVEYLVLGVGEGIGILCKGPSDWDLPSTWVQVEIVKCLGCSSCLVFNIIGTSLSEKKSLN